MKKNYTSMFYAILITVLIISCSGKGGGRLEKQTLFEVGYGRMEDQIEIDQASENMTPRKNRIIMQNGIFHISNGKSCKIMEFNSYGEILNLYYNESKNPEPVILNRSRDEEETSTRNVYSYPFIDVGEIGIDSEKRLYVDDRIAENRIEHDEELGVPLDRIILQFDQNGKYIDYLGQEGSGGTPFSYIEKIRLTMRDELVVFSRNTAGWKVFWFSADGRPLFIVDIDHDSLPFPSEDEKQHSFSDLETVDCDMTMRTLYLKIDYYRDLSKDPNSDDTGIVFHNSLIWNLDVGLGTYDKYVVIPAHIKEEEKPSVYEDEVQPLLYEFAGTSGEGVFYLISLDGRNAYNLMLLNSEGRVVQNIDIDMGNDRLLIRELFISRDGIMTGLLGWKDKMEVVWWRTDKFLKKDVE